MVRITRLLIALVLLLSLLVVKNPQLSAAQKSPGKTVPASKGGSGLFSQVTVLDASDVKHEAARQTYDGGYITITSVDSTIGTVVTKFNTTGKKLWDRSFGFNWPVLTVSGMDIQQTTDGGYLATGLLEENRSNRLWVLRLDPAGKTVWEKRLDKSETGDEYPDARGNALVLNSDGSFMIAAVDFNQDCIHLIKFSSTGEIIWKKRFPHVGLPQKQLHALTDLSRRRAVWLVAQDSGYLMAYHTKDPSSPKKSSFFRVMRLDGQGDPLWATDIVDQLGYPKKAQPQLHSLISTSDGGLALLVNLSTFGAGCVVKFNKEGKLEWRSRPEVLNEEFTGQMFGGGLVELPTGGYAAAMSFMPGERLLGHHDSAVLFLKMDRSGSITGTRIFGNKNSWHLIHLLQQTRDGGFIVGGFHASNKNMTALVGKHGAWLLKLDASGNNPSVPQVTGIKIGARIFTYQGNNERKPNLQVKPAQEIPEQKLPVGAGGYNFTHAYQFYEGFARVERKTPDGFVIGFMDTSGGIWSLPENWFALYQYSDGLVGFSPERNGLWGFMDKTGKAVIPARFEFVGNFRNGLAPVKTGGKWGYIDKTGSFVIPPKYGDQGPGFYEGLAKMQQDGKTGFIDRNGRTVIPFRLQSAESFSDGLARFTATKKNHKGEDEDLIGYLSKTGKVVIPASFVEAQDFSEGLAAVKRKDEKWRYIDKTGKTVIPPRFDTADSFHEGLAYTSITTEPGYIDRSGKKVIALPEKKTEFGYWFSDGMAMVSLKGKNSMEYGTIGFIDKRGQWKIPLRSDLSQYADWAALGKFRFSFSDGYMAVSDRNEASPTKGNMGFIDKQGNLMPWTFK